MFPTAICMAFEMATYGLVAGLLYKVLPNKKWSVYVSLISSMVIGRIVWGIAMLVCMGFDTNKFGFTAFLSGAVTSAIPGIILQIVVIPVLVFTLRKYVEKER
jgi:cell shape-determining protein MreD